MRTIHGDPTTCDGCRAASGSVRGFGGVYEIKHMARCTYAKRVKTRKHNGDDRYSWAMFVDGALIYQGIMDKSEADWRARTAVRNLMAGRRWNVDAPFIPEETS
jgi:hypothetical protein